MPDLKKTLKSMGTLLPVAAIFVFGFVNQRVVQSAGAVLPAPLPTPPQTVVEQMVRGNTEKNRKTNLNVPVTKKPSPAAQPKTTTNKTPKRPVRPRTPKQIKVALPQVEERQQVVFATGATGVEILIDGKSYGMSDKNAKLTVWVANGEHQIVARKYNQDLFPSSTIEVSAEQKDFDFSAQVAKSLDELRLTQKEPENEANAETKTVDVVAILEAYRDPNRTSTVTAKEWQAIYEQSQRKLMFGSTDNEVEGLYTFAQGQVELSLGNKVKALNLFEAAANIYVPNSAMMHYGLGSARLAAGSLPEAGASFMKSLQLDPQSALAYKGLGDVYLAQDKPKEAATQYQQAQRLGMTTPELRLKIAEVQIKNKNCSSAVKELEVLQKEAPSAGVLMALSDCYLEEKRAVSAIDVLVEAVKLDPNLALVHYKLGAIYLKQKEFGKAKESLERALALDAENKLNRKELKEMISKAQKNVR